MATPEDEQKAEAERLQEQIDQLVRGESDLADESGERPTNLRDFIHEKMARDLRQGTAHTPADAPPAPARERADAAGAAEREDERDTPDDRSAERGRPA